jgi:hypothetical protein
MVHQGNSSSSSAPAPVKTAANRPTPSASASTARDSRDTNHPHTNRQDPIKKPRDAEQNMGKPAQ